MKHTIKKWGQMKNDAHFALLQIRSTLVSTGLSHPAKILFNRLIRALLPQIGRQPININNDDKYYEALKSRQEAYAKNNDTCKDSTLFPSGSTAVVQMEDDGDWDTWHDHCKKQ